MLDQREIDRAFARPERGQAATLHAHRAEKLGKDCQTIGFDARLPVSLSLFDVSGGFAEEVWLDAIPNTVFAKRLSGAQVQCRHGRFEGRTSARSGLALQPKGTPNAYVAHGPVRFLQLYLTDTLIDRVADGLKPGSTASGRLRDDLVFRPDQRLDGLVDAYVAAALAGETLLELEARAILLVGHLLRAQHGFGDAGQRAARGGLTPRQLRLASEAMEAGLDQDLSLENLATLAGCSPTHFSRAFKASTGVAPFTWLLNRRIERARALLLDRSMPLAEVALAVGFSAQPQFTTAFRRVTGTTPGAWRRECPT